MQDAKLQSPRSELFRPHNLSLTDGRGPRGVYMRMISCRLVLAIALIAASGCDSGSDKNLSGTASPRPPASAPEVPPPRDIPPESLPNDATKLNVEAAFPGPGEARVALVSPVSVEFDEDLLAGQTLTEGIRVTTGDGTEVPGTVSQTSDDSLLFRPANPWQANTLYSVEIDPALMSDDGRLVDNVVRWNFTTIADVHTTPQSVIDLCMSDADVEMLATVNRARTSARDCRGVPYPATGKLVWNCRLQEAAITHSQDMASNNFFEHAGSDGSNHVQRISRTGYVARATGENLAAGYRSIEAAVEGLLTSTKGHCEIIMEANFTEFGSGYAVNPDSDYQRYWTQNFAQPR